MTTPYFFDKLPLYSWGKSRQRIYALTNGKPSDWRKTSLQWARARVKRRLLRVQRYRCAYCRSELSDELGRVEIDHVVPKELAPQFCYHPLNLVVCCKRCNSNKGQRNTTTFTSGTLAVRKRYIRSSGKFAWVHPCFDSYKDHIVISGDFVFGAKDGCKKGLAVIQGCKLDRMAEVLARRRHAAAMAAQHSFGAILTVVGQNPGVAADELVEHLRKRPDIGLSTDELTEIVNRLLGSNPAHLLVALRLA